MHRRTYINVQYSSAQLGVNGDFKDGNAGAPWGTRARRKEREGGKGKFCEDWSLTALAVRRGESLEPNCTVVAAPSLHLPLSLTLPCPAAAKIASSPTFRGIICFCCSRIEVAAAGQSSCRLDARGCCPPRAPICKQLAIFRFFIRYRGTL